MRRRTLLLGLPLLFAMACSDEGPDVANITVTFQNLTPLEAATEGSYEGWVIGQGGAPVSTGKFVLAANGVYSFTSPIPNPTMFVLTLEPPGDDDAVPSDQKLLGGTFAGGSATLTTLGFVSASASANFTASPGTHVLLTPTNGMNTNEDAGLWLLNPPAPGGMPTASVMLPPLAAGWVYEGWIVFRAGTAQQVAISYGKYRPLPDGTLSGRDGDAGGPFSGAPGDLMAGPPFPGGDFVAANGTAVPGGLTLPFDFNGDDATMGDSEWMHVITIEPAFDEGEASLAAKPFQLKPFGNPFGDGGPTDARTINPLSPLPAGTAVIGN
jgi:hypothetical protein